MMNIPRFIVVVLPTGNGLIRLLDAAKGLGLAEVNQLSQPNGRSCRRALDRFRCARPVHGPLLATGVPTSWLAVGGAAAITSPLAIATSRCDARASIASTLRPHQEATLD
jgi:hypothetical protein